MATLARCPADPDRRSSPFERPYELDSITFFRYEAYFTFRAGKPASASDRVEL